MVVIDHVWIGGYGSHMLSYCVSLASVSAGILLWCYLDEWMTHVFCRNLATVVAKHIRTVAIYV